MAKRPVAAQPQIPPDFWDSWEPVSSDYIMRDLTPWYTLVQGREWDYQKLDVDAVNDGICND